MGNTLTEIEAYAQDVATFSQAIETGFQALSSTFPALLANFQSLLTQCRCLRQLAAQHCRRTEAKRQAMTKAPIRTKLRVLALGSSVMSLPIITPLTTCGSVRPACGGDIDPYGHTRSIRR